MDDITTIRPDATASDDDLLSTRDAAALAGFTDSHFEKLRIKGGGPKFKKFGRIVRYERSAVKEWINNFRTMRTTRQPAA